MSDDTNSTGERGSVDANPSVRRRRLLAGAGALAFGAAAVPTVGTAAPSSPSPRVVWQRRYGGGGYDAADAIVRTAGGGYAFAGHKTTDLERFRGGLWIAALDTDGALVRQRVSPALDGYQTALVAGPDGELAVASGKQSGGDAVVVAFERPFEEAWRARFSVPEEYQGDALAVAPADIVRTSDGGYVVAGSLSFSESAIGWVGKVTTDGETAWSTLIEGPHSVRHSVAENVAHTADGGYLVCGAAAVGRTDGGEEVDLRPWAAKLTADRDAAWNRTYLDEYGSFESVVPRGDGFVFGGDTVEGPFSGPFKHTPVILWIDAGGDVECTRPYPKTPVSVSGFVPSGDGYAWAGTTLDLERDRHGWGVVKVDRNGNRRWSLVRKDDPITLRTLVAADGSYGLAGTTWPFNENGVDDAWVAELTTDAE